MTELLFLHSARRLMLVDICIKFREYEGWSKSSDRCLVALSSGIFERHTLHHSNHLVFTFIMMLIFSRCTVSINNYSTLYMVYSIPLAFFHIIEL